MNDCGVALGEAGHKSMSEALTDIDAEQADALPTIRIRPTYGWASLQLGAVWEYRELLYLMVWREIQGRYRQTALGISWLVMRPLVNMVLLSLVFGRLLNVPSDGVPYPLFSLAALLPWTYFSSAVQRASNGLVDNMHVISKVYFPRMIVPLAAVLSGLVDFFFSFGAFLVALLAFRMPLRLEMLWLPALLLVMVAIALASGLWLATLSVRYRDVQFGLAFLLQALMYASPVIYPVSSIPPQLRTFYYLNPLTGVIQGFRWAFLGSGEPPGGPFLLSVGVIFIALVSGAFVFRRTERTIVDLL